MMLAKIHCLTIKNRFCLYACCWIALASALWLRCLLFFPRPLTSHFLRPYISFFQHLASPEGIRALSGATSPNARRLNQTVQTWGLNSAGLIVLWSLIIVEVDFCQLSLSCHNWMSAPLSLSWQPVQLCRWFSATTAGVLERTWPREDLYCGTSVHKKHKERCSRGAAPPLAYLCDFFVDAESLYFYWLWRSDGRGPLEYEAGLSGLAEAAQPAPAFTLTRAAPGL